MPEQVRVDDLEVFKRFRASVLKFAQAASNSLSNADSEISSTHAWLDGEQASYWQIQLRKRTEAVAKARDAVRQKKLYKDSSGRTPSAVEEEKILARCVAAVEEAQRKIENVRRWLPRLEKEAGLYRSGVAALARTLSGDVPNAVALLDRLSMSIEAYVEIEAPAPNVLETTASAGGGQAMTRGDGPDAPPAPAAENVTPPPEDKHVADGQ
jgi:hypothetical protein